MGAFLYWDIEDAAKRHRKLVELPSVNPSITEEEYLAEHDEFWDSIKSLREQLSSWQTITEAILKQQWPRERLAEFGSIAGLGVNNVPDVVEEDEYLKGLWFKLDCQLQRLHQFLDSG